MVLTRKHRAKKRAAKHNGVFAARGEAQRLAFAPLMFQAAYALRDLGILRVIEREPKSVAEIGERAKITAEGIRVLLLAAESIGLVERQAEDKTEDETGRKIERYRATLLGRVVLNDELTRVNMDFVQDVCWKGAARLGEAVKTETPAGLFELGQFETVYHGLKNLPPQTQTSWYRFDEYYSDAAFPQAFPHVFAARPKQFLDVGCGQGRFSLFCLRNDPAVRVTVVDMATHVQRALDSARGAGFDGRIDGRVMDLLDHSRPLPAGYDAVWMSQFLDCFGGKDVVSLMARGAAALSSGGRLYVLEPCRDRQPDIAGRYCVDAISLYFTCIANGKSRFYSAAEIEAFAAEAGLSVEREVDGLGIGHTLFVCKPGAATKTRKSLTARPR